MYIYIYIYIDREREGGEEEGSAPFGKFIARPLVMMIEMIHTYIGVSG